MWMGPKKPFRVVRQWPWWCWTSSQGSWVLGMAGQTGIWDPVLSFARKKPLPPRVFFHQGFNVLFDPTMVVKEQGNGAMHPFTREFFHPSDRTRLSSPAAVARFYDDDRRFPPAAYEEGSLLWRDSAWRQPEPSERCQMMGWPSQFTSKSASSGGTRPAAVQNSLIGNGFHIPTMLAVLCLIPQILATKLPRPL